MWTAMPSTSTRWSSSLTPTTTTSRHDAKQAHQALAQAAKRLTQEALRTPLPKAAEQAMAAGKPWRGTLKAATLELVREDWPTGKGYTLNFVVRPGQ
jgi:hypothetical protein